MGHNNSGNSGNSNFAQPPNVPVTITPTSHASAIQSSTSSSLNQILTTPTSQSIIPPVKPPGLNPIVPNTSPNGQNSLHFGQNANIWTQSPDTGISIDGSSSSSNIAAHQQAQNIQAMAALQASQNNSTSTSSASGIYNWNGNGVTDYNQYQSYPNFNYSGYYGTNNAAQTAATAFPVSNNSTVSISNTDGGANPEGNNAADQDTWKFQSL